MSSDYLYQAATAFKNLLPDKYRLVLGRRGKSFEMVVAFNPADFFHLSGLQKLNDYRLNRLPKDRIFNAVLRKEISDTVLSKCAVADDILQRIQVLTRLEILLDDNNTDFFSFNAKTANSRIRADYIAAGLLDGSQVVFSFFIKGDERNISDRGVYRVNSVFPLSERDYSLGQTKYTVLLKEKFTANDKVLLYRHKNFNVA